MLLILMVILAVLAANNVIIVPGWLLWFGFIVGTIAYIDEHDSLWEKNP